MVKLGIKNYYIILYLMYLFFPTYNIRTFIQNYTTNFPRKENEKWALQTLKLTPLNNNYP